jgi:phospholipid/cholesterol/gamma-HCH transport system substrate-binding protein
MAISNETKVGLLVVAALGGLAWLSVKSGSFGVHLATPTRDFESSFGDVNGLTAGSAVKMAGVPVGEIKGIKLLPNGTAVVSYEVKKDVPLPADVSAEIDSNGLIGEKFLSLVPGPAGKMGQGGLLAEGVEQIPGVGAVSGVGEMGGNFAKVSSDLEQMTGTLKSVLGNPENAQKLQNIIDGLSALSSNLQGNSGQIIENAREATESLKVILARLQDPRSPLGSLIMGNGTSGTLGGLGDLQAAMANFNQVMAKVNSGQGTLGKLVNDPQTAEKINSALDSLSNITKKVDQFKTDLDFQAYSLAAEDAGKGQFALTLQPNPDRYYLVGVTADGLASNSSDLDRASQRSQFGKDFGRNVKYTAQFGHIWHGIILGQDLGFRIGLKDSTGGIGFDTRMPGFDRLRLSADLYDWGGTHTPGTKNPHVDLKAMYPIYDGFYGLAGYDNLLSAKYGSPIVGLGYHWEDEDLKYLLGRAL